MRLAVAVLTCLLATGCDSFSAAGAKPTIDNVNADIHVVDKLPGKHSNSVLGLARYNLITGKCEIFIRADVYPACITHEVRHCFEGNWHGERKTTEFCIVDE